MRVLVSVCLLWSWSGLSAGESQEVWHVVSRVVDGDTVQLENGDRVNLIGVDAPELHQTFKLDQDLKRFPLEKQAMIELGQKATDFLRSLCEGKRVRLTYEVKDLKAYDKYNRIRGYLQLEDETVLNEELLRQGHARAHVRQRDQTYEKYTALERKAREAQRGLWKTWPAEKTE